LSEKVSSVKRQQDEAIDLENYAEAEDLEKVLRQFVEMKGLNEKEIARSEATLHRLEKEKEQLMIEEVRITEKMIIRLRELENENVICRDSYRDKESHRITGERKDLEEELDRITINISHNELTLKHNEEERAGMEQNIDKQSKEYKNKLDNLQKSESELKAAIIQIEQELKRKKAELETVTANMVTTSKKIKNIRSKFEDHLQKINSKMQAALREQNEYQEEKRKLDSSLGRLQKEEAVFNENIRSFESVLGQIKKTKEGLEGNARAMNERQSHREQLIRKYEVSKGAYDEFNERLKSQDKESEELQKKIQQCENEIEEIKHQVTSVEQKIPILEKEKKIAAGERRFGEAGQIAAEIKELKEQQKSYEASRVMLEDQKASHAKALMIIKAESGDKEIRLRSLQEKLDIDRYYLLKQQTKDLTALLEFSDGRKSMDEISILELDVNFSKG
jgi:chromosome segregation ATPase